MAEAKTARATDPVRQFSVFAENRVGRLYDLTTLFKDHQVHIMAITVLDTTDCAVIRLIVDDREAARDLMVENDFPFTECDVLVVEINDERLLRDVLASLLEAEINVHYVYSFIKRPDGKSAFALNVEDADVAAQALNARGFKVLTQRDIAR
ncbi:MAG TPA: acetolactate synthase [Opitutaceae bacterium]|nr:acetolactate synthase [Opitutaceae bacterium]HND61550.1 acetolactate synthase [Opitutaceae bacterium]